MLENPGAAVGTFRQLGNMRALQSTDVNGNFAHQRKTLRPAVRCSDQECCEKKRPEYPARGTNGQRLSNGRRKQNPFDFADDKSQALSL